MTNADGPAMEPDEHGARYDEKADEYDETSIDEHEACVELVVEYAREGLGSDDVGEGLDDVVLDLGAGTGAISLELADDAGRVVGRDVSEGMLDRAREKAQDREIENAEFDTGRFREPNYEGPVDVVTSNFAMHHIDDEGKREAIAVIGELGPRRFVLGDLMFFGEPDPSEPYYDPAVDDPSTVGLLVDALTDAGFVVTAVEQVHDQVGVLVADRPAFVGDQQ